MLIFQQVCNSTADCNEAMNQYVPDDGTWFLQDQLGPWGGTGPGWFSNEFPHMRAVDSKLYANLAAKFKGEGFCMFGDCAICLRLFDKGLVSPCPMVAYPDRGHIGPATNPNNCKAYRFQEVACVKGVPAQPTL